MTKRIISNEWSGGRGEGKHEYPRNVHLVVEKTSADAERGESSESNEDGGETHVEYESL